ncbi:MAG: hypothetical protein AB1Z98_35950 [Nannocystaceae bacterium]
MNALLVSLLASWLGARAAQPAELSDPRARALFEQAAERWQAGDYEQADAALAAAAAIEPIPALQYARGQLAREQGDCERALELYAEFLEHTEPGTRAREEVLMNMARCEATMPEPDETPAAVEPTVARSVVVDPAPVAAAPPRRADPVATGLIAGGSVAIAAGIGLSVAAGIDRRAAAATDGLQQFERRRRRSQVEIGVAAAAGSIGVALLVAGVVRLLSGRRRSQDARRTSAATIRF